MKVKKIFPHLARRDQHYVPLYTAFASGRTTPKYLALALYLLHEPGYATGRGPYLVQTGEIYWGQDRYLEVYGNLKYARIWILARH